MTVQRDEQLMLKSLGETTVQTLFTGNVADLVVMFDGEERGLER